MLKDAKFSAEEFDRAMNGFIFSVAAGLATDEEWHRSVREGEGMIVKMCMPEKVRQFIMETAAACTNCALHRDGKRLRDESEFITALLSDVIRMGFVMGRNILFSNPLAVEQLMKFVDACKIENNDTPK